MSRDEYIRQNLLDAISALDVQYSTPRTEPMKVGDDFIYPQIAIERIRSVLNVDRLFPKEGR